MTTKGARLRANQILPRQVMQLSALPVVWGGPIGKPCSECDTGCESPCSAAQLVLQYSPTWGPSGTASTR